MFKHYINIIWRNLNRNKSYSFINILGLSIGISCTILIFAWVKYELSFDQYHKYKEWIYRIQRYPFCSLAPSFVPLLEQDFPEMEHIMRFTNAGEPAVKIGDKVFVEDYAFFAEKDVFEAFSL